MQNNIAIIPARGGSKGIPRKNLCLLNGTPLVAHSINQAHETTNITHVYVSTEDHEIGEISKAYNANVIGRPNDMIHDNTFMEVDRLLKWTVEKLEQDGLEIDMITMLYPTAPLREVQNIKDTVDKVMNQGYDSALTLTFDTSYLWKITNGKETAPINYDPKTRGPRQLEDWNQWAENKAVYAMKKALLLETGCRLGGKIGWVEMSKSKSIDIDSPDDLKLAEALIKL